MADIKILFWFDVEDFINPESEEALLGILELLDKRGITGIFKLVGEKARAIARHGRSDILDRLKRHEIGYHTDWHSVHPVVTAYMEPLGFREGAEAFDRNEAGGFRDVQRITGRSAVCYGQPGLSWAPQPYAALNKWGVRAYLDSHDLIGLEGRPFWYGGLLNLMSLRGIMSLPLEDGALEPAKQTFDRLCAEQEQESVGFISIVYHPTEFVFAEFWDAVNFAKGNNPPASEWVKPAFRPEGEMRKFLGMVGEFVDYTLARENVQYVGTADVLALEKTTQANRALTGDELAQLAAAWETELNYQVHGDWSLSAAELFGVFRRHVLGEEAIVETIYGPERDCPGDPPFYARVAAIVDTLRAPLPQVCGFAQLPDTFVVEGKRASPAAMAGALAAIVRGGLGNDDTVHLADRKLEAAKHAASDGAWAKQWVIFPDDLQVPNILAMSELQAWTLKPALFRRG
ncbi:MAG: hypothetical protein J7639_29560 [Paenibacillaceae bacterium]|nr:hypothetical protein [Paenibacillaceae bacterium]